MADATFTEPFMPAAFDLPDGSRSEEVAYPARPLHVLLATTGSVASIKAPLIVQGLLEYQNIEIQVVATKSSLTFYDPAEVEKIARSAGRNVKVWQDEEEWSTWKKTGDPILHIELRRWADIVLIAPLSANTLAKLSNGICDNLLTSLMRALDVSKTEVYVFPAMNTMMWDHPFTEKQLDILKSIRYNVVGPIGKLLSCGDIGLGAMTEWREIVELVVRLYKLKRLEGI